MAQSKKRHKPNGERARRSVRKGTTPKEQAIFSGLEVCDQPLEAIASVYACWVLGEAFFEDMSDVRLRQGISPRLEPEMFLTGEHDIANGAGLNLKTRWLEGKGFAMQFGVPEEVDEEAGALRYLHRISGDKALPRLKNLLVPGEGCLPVYIDHHVQLTRHGRNQTMVAHSIIASTFEEMPLKLGPCSPDVFRLVASKWGTLHHRGLLSPDSKQVKAGCELELARAIANPKRPLPLLVMLAPQTRPEDVKDWEGKVFGLWEGAFPTLVFKDSLTSAQWAAALEAAGLPASYGIPDGGARLYLPGGDQFPAKDHPVWKADEIDPRRTESLEAFAVEVGRFAMPLLTPTRMQDFVVREDKRREEEKLQFYRQVDEANEEAMKALRLAEEAARRGKEEVERLERAVARADRRTAEATAEVESLKAKHAQEKEEARVAADALRSAHRDLLDQLHASEAKRRDLEGVLEKLGGSHEGVAELAASEMRLRKEVEAHAADVARLTAALQEKTKEAEALQAKVGALEGRVEGLLHLPVAAGASPQGNDRAARLEAVLRGDPTLEQALAFLQESFPDRLVVLASAMESARAAAGFLYRERAFEMLKTLVTDFWAALKAGGDVKAREVFGKDQYAAVESETVTDNARARALRTFWYKGEPVVMLRHLKIGTKDSVAETMRVHFHWDAEDSKIVIGHAGQHLDHG